MSIAGKAKNTYQREKTSRRSRLRSVQRRSLDHISPAGLISGPRLSQEMGDMTMRACWKLKLRELALKRDELRTIGTPEQKLHRAVDTAERTLVKTVSNYEVAVSEQILAKRYGQPVPLMKLDRRERDSLKLHKRISDLRKFSVHSRSETDVSAEALLRRLNVAGERLVALLEYIEQDQRQHNAKK
jgi:hypothetical protein